MRLHDGHIAQRDEPGLDELLWYRLATWGTHLDGFIAADIRTAELSFTHEAREQINEALARLEGMQSLTDKIRTASSTGAVSGIRSLPRLADMSHELGKAIAGATSSMYTSHPLDRPPETLERAKEIDPLIRRRGVAIRIIYLDNARTRRPEQEYAAVMIKEGAEIRTALPPFERMIIVDERIAFVADHDGNPEDKPGLMITHPSLVKLLTNIYEQQWDHATPWNGEARVTGTFLPRYWRILQRLSEAWSLKAIATELELSPSTLYGDMRRLYSLTGTSTEFQLAMWYAENRERQHS
ncbi:hypothetical protein [Streptomyces sp. NRRL S-920]|uniref:hypothetical protein n=1 Tax=Streptomyces sp. NRRL S-920 TaxID=1463921 RepID=UPI00131BC93A|nr:hypothetical protein [Streptomyces sp. NRRL S-920]